MKNFIHCIPPYLPSAIVILLVLYFTLAPHPLPPNRLLLFPYADKVVHALMMAVVVLVLVFDTKRRKQQKSLSPLIMLVIVVSVIIFGGLIEIAQGAMGLGRSSDIADFVADIVGAIISYIAITCYFLRKTAANG